MVGESHILLGLIMSASANDISKGIPQLLQSKIHVSSNYVTM